MDLEHSSNKDGDEHDRERVCAAAVVELFVHHTKVLDVEIVEVLEVSYSEKK